MVYETYYISHFLCVATGVKNTRFDNVLPTPSTFRIITRLGMHENIGKEDLEGL